MRSRTLYWTEVEVGETLPPLLKAQITRLQLVRYAGAAWDFNPLHVDDVRSREVGRPGICAPGLMIMGFLGQLLVGWAGPRAWVKNIGTRFVKMVWPGDIITCCGRVDSLLHDNGRYSVIIELWAENQRGELVAKGSGEVRLFHSPEDEARQMRGEGPLVLSENPPPSLQERIGLPMKSMQTKKKRKKKQESTAVDAASEEVSVPDEKQPKTKGKSTVKDVPDTANVDLTVAEEERDLPRENETVGAEKRTHGKRGRKKAVPMNTGEEAGDEAFSDIVESPDEKAEKSPAQTRKKASAKNKAADQ